MIPKQDLAPLRYGVQIKTWVDFYNEHKTAEPPPNPPRGNAKRERAVARLRGQYNRNLIKIRDLRDEAAMLEFKNAGLLKQLEAKEDSDGPQET